MTESRSALAIAVAGLCCLATPSADATLRAPSVELLPGYERTRVSSSAGIGALTSHLPKALDRHVRKVRGVAEAAAGGGQRVQVTLFELAPKRAWQIVSAWGAGARRAGAKPGQAQVGSGGRLTTRGAAAIVVWSSRRGIGVVHLRGPAQPSRGASAVAFAQFADRSLSAPPPPAAWERVLDRVRPDGTLPKQAALQAF